MSQIMQGYLTLPPQHDPISAIPSPLDEQLCLEASGRGAVCSALQL